MIFNTNFLVFSSRLFAILVIFLVLLLLATLPPKGPEPLLTSIQLTDAVNGTGSGVIIRSDETESYVLTNKHVCEALDPKITQAVIPSLRYDIVKAEEVKRSLKTDLCIYKIQKGKLPVSRLAKNVAIGTKIHNVGCPQGICEYGADGYLGKPDKVAEIDVNWTWITIYPGSSGSGIFNDNNELVGLISMGNPYAPNMALSIPLEDIRDFIKSVVDRK